VPHPRSKPPDTYRQLKSRSRPVLDAGASAEEIRHALLLLTSTIGFPTVAAAMSWADDVLRPGKRRAKPKAGTRRRSPARR